jgi:23S rRNA U2552 (ribose-2'-O)-methylase RlmE/FtsJ
MYFDMYVNPHGEAASNGLLLNTVHDFISVGDTSSYTGVFGQCDVLTEELTARTLMSNLVDEVGRKRYIATRDRIFPAGKSAGGVKTNRAAWKIEEILGPSILENLPNGFSFLDVCGGPGSWSTFLLDNRKDCTGVGVTKRDCPRSDRWYPALMKDKRWRFVNGANHSDGNILLKGVVVELMRRPRFNLVMCDGFGCSGDDVCQENFQIPIIIAEMMIMFRKLIVGGDFVMKIFTTWSKQTISLLWILSRCFDSFAIVKPQSSRCTNFERYVQCRGFRPRSADVLEPVIEKWYNSYTLPNIRKSDHIPLNIVPWETVAADAEFLKFIKQSTIRLSVKTTLSINKVYSELKNEQ